jgi:putative membrane protein
MDAASANAIEEKVDREKKSRLLINIISVVIPLVVAVLLALPNKLELGAWTKSLPHVIGSINTLTTLALILGLIFIKSKKIDAHRLMMNISFALGGVFLVCYVAYHISNPANRFGGAGFIRYFYFFTLITHVGLSFIVLPLVLRAMLYALTRQFSKHKSVVRFAYPIWLYVSASGVLVYLMLYHLSPAK